MVSIEKMVAIKKLRKVTSTVKEWDTNNFLSDNLSINSYVYIGEL